MNIVTNSALRIPTNPPPIIGNILKFNVRLVVTFKKRLHYVNILLELVKLFLT